MIQTKTLLGFPKLKVAGAKSEEIGANPFLGKPPMLRFSWDKLNLENPKIKIMQDECENFETYLGHLFKSIEKSYLRKQVSFFTNSKRM